MHGSAALLARMAIAGFALALVWPFKAHAQSVYHWYPTKSGCQVWGDEEDFGPGFTWTGKCNASNHIEGAGSLAYFSDEGKKNVEFVGEFIDGRPHGSFQYNAFVGDDAWPSPHHKVRFDMGCYVFDSGVNADCRLASGSGKPVLPAAPRAATAASDLQASLKTSSADQLLAMARQLLQSGDVDLAKMARDALVQRFPDSPLAMAAVQLFADAVTPVASPSLASAAVVQPPALTSLVHLNNAQDIVSAFARFGVGMSATNGDDAREAHNFYDARASDCANGRCGAIQLVAMYKFAALPSYNLVQSWDLDMLYGRAYTNGHRVHFDMVLRIPAEGVDIKVLEDFVTTYKASADRFYGIVSPPR